MPINSHRNIGPKKGWMKALYGFGKPYDFHKAIPVLVGAFLCFLTFIISGLIAAAGNLNWNTLRLEYFVYLAGLLVLGMFFSFFPPISWLLYAIWFTELVMGIGTAGMTEVGITPRSFLPENQNAHVLRQFQYHPLLQVVPTPNYLRSTPFLVQHDSNGTRGRERTSAEIKQQIVVATVGGSSTYDVKVANGQTWSDALERRLGPSYAVINKGVPGYSTVENLLETIFYLDAYGVKPRCAVYYVGWNDIRNAHLPLLDQAYANFHLLAEIDTMKVRRILNTFEFSPLMRRIQLIFDTIPSAPDLRHYAPTSGSDDRLEQIYRTNLKAIAAINKDRQINTIFIGQLLNKIRLQSEARYGWLPLVRDVDVWPLMDHFNHILSETAESIGVPHFIPPIDKFDDADFVDQGHFSVKGSSKFALMILPLVKLNCN